jgi:hypothetical protein
VQLLVPLDSHEVLAWLREHYTGPSTFRGSALLVPAAQLGCVATLRWNSGLDWNQKASPSVAGV